MYTVQPQDKKEFYLKLTEQLRSLVEGESFYLPNLANAAALLFNALPDINWSGFYLMHGGELVLGPFRESRVYPNSSR